MEIGWWERWGFCGTVAGFREGRGGEGRGRKRHESVLLIGFIYDGVGVWEFGEGIGLAVGMGLAVGFRLGTLRKCEGGREGGRREREGGKVADDLPTYLSPSSSISSHPINLVLLSASAAVKKECRCVYSIAST